MRSRPDLTFRQDYFDDPAGWAAIKRLLVDIFDVDVSPLDMLGGHDRTSFPSAFFDESGRCVANLSAFSMPLTIDGRTVKAAGWQSGAVRPDYRGRGLFRDLIRITLERCDQLGFEAVVLYTDKPSLYEPHGFRIVPQYSFRGEAPKTRGIRQQARPVSMDRDLGLIKGLLARRAPVSRRFAVADQSLMFLLNCWLVEDVGLSLLSGGETVVAWRLTDEGVFQLLDIVGPDIPPLGDILAGLELSPMSVEAFVTPDQLSWSAKTVADTGSLVFMMRAKDDLYPSGPCCLSPMAGF